MSKFYCDTDKLYWNRGDVIVDFPLYKFELFYQHIITHLNKYILNGRISISFSQMFTFNHWILETNTVFLKDDLYKVYTDCIKNNSRLLIHLRTGFKIK